MALVVKQDVPARPIHIRLLGADAIVLDAAEGPDLVEEFGAGLLAEESYRRVCSLYFCLYIRVKIIHDTAQELDNQCAAQKQASIRPAALGCNIAAHYYVRATMMDSERITHLS